MRHLISFRYSIRQNFLPIIGLCLCAYFSYHSAFGTRSYFRLVSLEKQERKLSAQYDSLHEERLALEDRVVRLRPTSLDPDLLEERARELLGYGYQDEKIILLTQ